MIKRNRVTRVTCEVCRCEYEKGFVLDESRGCVLSEINEFCPICQQRKGDEMPEPLKKRSAKQTAEFEKSKDWRQMKLNHDDRDLIYETPGDAERGNPLDIIHAAEVYGGEDVTGFHIPTFEFRDELLKRWNDYPEIIAAARELIASLDGSYAQVMAARNKLHALIS